MIIRANLGFTEEQLKGWIEEGSTDKYHISHKMVEGKIPFQVALGRNRRYVYLPETRKIRIATVGSDAEKVLDADMKARAERCQEYADQLALWEGPVKNVDHPTGVLISKIPGLTVHGVRLPLF